MDPFNRHGFESQPIEPSPAAYVVDALYNAEVGGVMPPFNADDLIDRLGLSGEEPDGQTLMDRFTGGEYNMRTGRDVLRMMGGVQALLKVTNERTASPAQEVLAQGLAGVVTRQLQREGDICEGAREFVASCKREDLIPAEVKALLGSAEPGADMAEESDGLSEDEAAMLRAAAERIAPLIEELMPMILARMIADTQRDPSAGKMPSGFGIPIIIPLQPGSPFDPSPSGLEQIFQEHETTERQQRRPAMFRRLFKRICPGNV